MTGLVWGLEWRRALRRRRLLLLNLLIPLALVCPIALSSAPPQHAASVYAVLFVLFGTFGSAIPLVRDAEGGLLVRIGLAGVPAPALVGGRTAADATLDLVQLSPSLVVILWAGSADARSAALAVTFLFVSLCVANVLGVWVAAVARSLAESALFAAVASLLLLHAAGVFRTPARGSVASTLERFAPFRPLHEALVGIVGPSPSAALTEGAGVAVVSGFFVVAGSVAAAPLLLAWLLRVDRS